MRLADDARVNVLERLPSGVLVLDSHGTVRYANVAARRALHPVPVRLGQALPATETADPPLDVLRRKLFQIGFLRDELLSLGKRTIRVSGSLDRHEGLGTIVLDDVTSQTRRTRTEEDFAVNVAHEILGPIAAITGAAEVLRDGAKDDPVARDRFIAHIADASARLTSIATALLVLAKSEAGLGGPRLELVPVLPVLEELRRGKEDVSVSCPPSTGVLADANLFRQALNTLVENARRHSRDGVGVTVADLGETVAVEIVDTGGGILPENLERVTDRFFSADGRDSGGYGVGLSIAARATKALGGTLDFASDRSGTRARLQLPSAKLL